MVRFKVRPRRDASLTPCAAPLTALLACFATTGDLQAKGNCAVAAKALHTCMATVDLKAGRKGKSSINHLLQKVK